MNKKALHTLEFHKIQELLEAEATSASGKKRCHALLPSTHLAEIETLQEETSAALNRLLKKGNPSFAGARDVTESIRRLEVGSSLNAAELLHLAGLLENAGRIKAYGARERDDAPADCLEPRFSSLDPILPISTEIRRCLLSESDVADDASPALRKIRRALAGSSDRIHAQLTALLNGPTRNALQDAVITMRNGRYCVPVKADSRAAVPGMIHDQSSTGATLFIEPMSVVQLNNEIRELELQEAAEIEAILASLSLSCAEHSATILMNMNTLIDLDVIFARGRLAIAMHATKPLYNTEERIRLRQARHPLIDRTRVVPIDLVLGDTFDLLIVTGPNTGGKTVSLKTAGLLALMGQAGLHIPCLDRSELPVFSEIYADIGDEQSIEQSLSTFSAHMTNIVSFLEKADRQSLVLFDELGAGTDPTEGAALAIAILSYLHAKGIRTMATTHYSELKIYALSTEGVENASCEFDINTLRPTYRLLIGIPGKSNAFAISSKLGLPDHIIAQARMQIGQQEASFEDVIARLESERLRMEKQEAALQKKENDLAERELQISKREDSLARQADQALDKATEEARRILLDAKEYADRTLKEFRKHGSAADLSALERSRTALREHLARTERPLKKGVPSPGKKAIRPQDLHPGDAVRVVSMNVNGIVRSEPDSKGNVFVQMGILRSKIPLTDLERRDEPDVLAKNITSTGSGKIKMAKSGSIRSEINLLGKTVDDAVQELDKYLDDAYLAHLDSVRIVHGKGTGALRKGIHQYLRRQKHISEFHLAEYGEGDAGVTIATFKK